MQWLSARRQHLIAKCVHSSRILMVEHGRQRLENDFNIADRAVAHGGRHRHARSTSNRHKSNLSKVSGDRSRASYVNSGDAFDAGNRRRALGQIEKNFFYLSSSRGVH